jgi:hypothetical protein
MASALAKRAAFSESGAIAQASTASLRVTPSTSYRTAVRANATPTNSEPTWHRGRPARTHQRRARLPMTAAMASVGGCIGDLHLLVWTALSPGRSHPWAAGGPHHAGARGGHGSRAWQHDGRHVPQHHPPPWTRAARHDRRDRSRRPSVRPQGQRHHPPHGFDRRGIRARRRRHSPCHRRRTERPAATATATEDAPSTPPSLGARSPRLTGQERPGAMARPGRHRRRTAPA